MDQTPSNRRRCARSICGLLPLAMIVYFFCYLDRINVSFAALQMNKTSASQLRLMA